MPTNLPWGIPIQLNNRPLEFINQNFFQPTFLYESFGSILIAIFLFTILWQQKNNLNKKIAMRVGAYYLALYSTLRFSLEFIKVDVTPILFGLRVPQIASILIFIIAIIIYKKSSHA